MAHLTNRLLWWAFVVSLLVYVGVAHVARIPGERTAPLDLLVPALALVSLGEALASLLYRRYALSGPIRSGRLDPSTPEGARRAFQPFVVNLALSESVGIYGLVLAFLSGDPVYAVAFSAAALVLLYLHRPTAPDLAPPRDPGARATDPTPLR